MADATNGEGRNKKPKRDKHVKVKVGGEFKAKVRSLPFVSEISSLLRVPSVEVLPSRGLGETEGVLRWRLGSHLRTRPS